MQLSSAGPQLQELDDTKIGHSSWWKRAGCRFDITSALADLVIVLEYFAFFVATPHPMEVRWRELTFSEKVLMANVVRPLEKFGIRYGQASRDICAFFGSRSGGQRIP